MTIVLDEEDDLWPDQSSTKNYPVDFAQGGRAPTGRAIWEATALAAPHRRGNGPMRMGLRAELAPILDQLSEMGFSSMLTLADAPYDLPREALTSADATRRELTAKPGSPQGAKAETSAGAGPRLSATNGSNSDEDVALCHIDSPAADMVPPSPFSAAVSYARRCSDRAKGRINPTGDRLRAVATGVEAAAAVAAWIASTFVPRGNRSAACMPGRLLRATEEQP